MCRLSVKLKSGKCDWNRKAGSGVREVWVRDVRIENVLSMVAPKPLYHPERPSFLRMRSRTAMAERLSFESLPFGRACIRVLALFKTSELHLVAIYEHIHI